MKKCNYTKNFCVYPSKGTGRKCLDVASLLIEGLGAALPFPESSINCLPVTQLNAFALISAVIV